MKKHLIFLLGILLLSVTVFNCKAKEGKPVEPNVTKESTAKIIIKEPWIRLVPASEKLTSAYMTIENSLAEVDRLISAKTDLANTTEIHEMTHENGVMKMRKIEGIDIPAKSSVTLQRGGLHLMLIGLTKEIKDNDNVKLTLSFKNAGEVNVTAKVKGDVTDTHKR